MKKLSEVTYEGHEYRIDLLKLIGKPVKAIVGYTSTQFGPDASFQLLELVFEDGTKLGIEGEHDFPYVVEYGREQQPNFDQETLNSLNDEYDKLMREKYGGDDENSPN